MKIYFVTKKFSSRKFFCYEFFLTETTTEVSITLFKSHNHTCVAAPSRFGDIKHFNRYKTTTQVSITLFKSHSHTCVAAPSPFWGHKTV